VSDDEPDTFTEAHRAFLALFEALKPFGHEAQIRALRAWLILFNEGKGP